AGDDCMISTYPGATAIDRDTLGVLRSAQDLISKVRELRNDHNVARNEEVTIYAENNALGLQDRTDLAGLISKLAVAGAVSFASDVPADATPVMVHKERFHIHLPVTIDPEEERTRLTKELDYYKGFVTSVERKLANERFVENAPDQIVEKERRKLADGLEKIRMIEESLASLSE
ncbi:MAG: hypothetical protein R3330_04275, partial [Saprospiraceae bacterium]|nr:hypothetical protein [Saprospiraceae bacterium]